MTTISVWREDFQKEIKHMWERSHVFPFVAIDTEFPGFLWNTPRDASEMERYADVKRNVDTMKPIQVGITLFDKYGNLGPTWEFNLKFDAHDDTHSMVSLNLLRSSGIDFEKHVVDGIEQREFGVSFKSLFLHGSHGRMQFVFFHGLYDMAYLMKLINNGRALPLNAGMFWAEAKNMLFRFYDVKHMARCSPELNYGEIGLEKTARVLGVERMGVGHQAGSDSRLTAGVFVEMKRRSYGMYYGQMEGILYSLETAQSEVIVVMYPQQRPQLTPIVGWGLVPIGWNVVGAC